jgi:starch-binding outer membrane protein SusE/F
MKYFKIIFTLFSFSLLFFASCKKSEIVNKDADLQNFSVGKASIISGSSAAVVPVPADSNNIAQSFTWTSPNYAQAPSLYKFVLQVDSSGRNFVNATSKTITGALTTSFTAKELNSIALSYGFNFNVAYDMDVRVISSYGNNNEQYKSNVIKFKYTPYVIPPKIALPTSGKLFLVGDASQGGWNNPVPAPSQEFAKLDATTFGGVFNLNGAKEYLILPVNGDWGNKFSVGVSNPAVSGGDFGFNLPNNFKGPATNGWYKIILDFQSGKYYVTPFTGTLPNNLFIVGGATPGGWNNPVPVPSQQFTRLNSSIFVINSISMSAGGEYLFLPVNGDWSNKYAVQVTNLPGLASGGDFGYNFPSNFPGPIVAGTYKITANFVTGKFSVQ